MADPYDEVPYLGHPFAQTHPDRLYTVGVLHGLDPARPEDSRVLEIGCGDGLNVVAMAAQLPGLRALGIDRAALPLERGRALAAEAGLEHVELRALDLTAAGDLGEFDYVVAHGVYSWVPEPVRAALLELIARVLAPDGLAFVSYNATPGAHVRRAMRDMIRFHGRAAAGPAERVARAREMSALFQRWPNRTDPFGAAIEAEFKRIDRLSDHSLVHDDAGDLWHPCSLSEFAARAQACGLRHVADAELHELRPDRFPAGVEEALHELAPGDPVVREQYGDYISGRAFRQTVLCRAERTPSNGPVATGIERLWFHTERRPDPLDDGSYASEVDRVCALLAAGDPLGTPASALIGHAAVPPAELLAALRAGAVTVRARPPRHAAAVPERPAASSIARLMARDAENVVTLDHESLDASDLFRRQLIGLLDGTRNRQDLLDALLAGVGVEIHVEVDDQPVSDPEVLRDTFGERLDAELRGLTEAHLILDTGDVAAS